MTNNQTFDEVVIVVTVAAATAIAVAFIPVGIAYRLVKKVRA